MDLKLVQVRLRRPVHPGNRGFYNGSLIQRVNSVFGLVSFRCVQLGCLNMRGFVLAYFLELNESMFVFLFRDEDAIQALYCACQMV